MDSEKRFVLIEKIKPWNYIDNRGNRVWLDKYGDFLKRQHPNGEFSTHFLSGTSANFTVELIQDLQVYGIDAEGELTALLSQQIAQEIDREIMTELINGNQL